MAVQFFTRAFGQRLLEAITDKCSAVFVVITRIRAALAGIIGLERVCAYTFAAPSTTISRRIGSYRSIYNLVRQEDFFTRLPPQN